MIQPIVRRLTGYDLETERLVFQQDIPDESWGRAKGIARLPAETETALASFPVTEAQARKIATLLGERCRPSAWTTSSNRSRCRHRSGASVENCRDRQ